MSDQVRIVGAGGFGREVAAMVHAIDSRSVISFVDDGMPVGTLVDGHEVTGGVDTLTDVAPANRWGTIALAIGNISVRQRVFESVKAAGYPLLTLVDPTACVRGRASLGEGVIICPSCVVSCGASVGDNTVLNIGAILGHDSMVGSHCNLNPGSIVLGDCALGQGVELGAGSQILRGVEIGSGVSVAMGASVFRSETRSGLLIGNPARLMPSRDGD